MRRWPPAGRPALPHRHFVFRAKLAGWLNARSVLPFYIGSRPALMLEKSPINGIDVERIARSNAVDPLPDISFPVDHAALRRGGE